MPRASIIITTHNRPQLLPRAVESAREAGSDVEIVVVDDASSDETANTCRRLSGINYIRVERNQRVAGARNIGMVASSGEYLTFLDDDDTRLAGSLDTQLATLAREPQAALIYGQAIWGDEEGRPQNRSYPGRCPQGDIFWKILTRNFIPCGSAVFRRSCLASVGLLDPDISGLDDWDLWVRLAEIYSIMSVETPVLIWRRSTPVSGQGTSRAASLVSQSAHQFRTSWMNLPRARHASRKTRRIAWQVFSEKMAEHLLWESARAVRRGKLGRPLRNFAVMTRLSPLSLMKIVQHRVLRLPPAGGPEALSFV